jgi:hypothetical protein
MWFKGAAMFFNRRRMNKKTMHVRAILVSIATALFLMLAQVAQATDIASLLIPPDFKNGSSLSIPLRIREHRIYHIDLDFASKGVDDVARTKALAGDAFTGCIEDNACGITTLIKIEIQDSRGNVLPVPMKSLLGPHGHYAVTLNGRYMRNLVTLPLNRGVYKLVATAIEVDQRIHSRQVELIVRFDVRISPLGK